ncbi:DUF4422 domain-containing protein [Sporolactobacillus sp. STCC-11]|uniref:DUF4422 domain-containing protein n=1 Tax=Sporolactobacillus caesalpiniae TaxID=3230362 RepID=UPI003397940B
MIIKVLVATHKKYRMPTDEMYTPIQVGKEGKPALDYLPDNTGINISIKNPNYCELTAMYWAWQNLRADYVGLVHYRRHFCNREVLIFNNEKKWQNILTSTRAEQLLEQYDVILPKKRNYWIETSMSHYEHAHNINDLRKTREIIEKIYPDFLGSFDQAMKQTASHRFNMFIMKQDIFREYSNWLFSILFELEKKIDITDYSPKEARVFGYISERLLDVWIDKKQISYTEVPVMFMEKQNWWKKGFSFLKRKFIGEH